MPVNHSQHGDYQIDSEDVVGISEEPDTSNDDGANVVPAEGSLVNLRKGETTTLIGIVDVGIVVVEVMEGSVTADRLIGRRCHCFGTFVTRKMKRRVKVTCSEYLIVVESEIRAAKGGGWDVQLFLICTELWTRDSPTLADRLGISVHSDASVGLNLKICVTYFE